MASNEANSFNIPTPNLELEDRPDLFHVSRASLSELSPHSLGPPGPNRLAGPVYTQGAPPRLHRLSTRFSSFKLLHR
jgi:hypothetical protein